MPDTINLNVKLVLEDCCSCGIQFGVPASWLKKHKDNHTSFYCPNGHKLHYPGPSEAEKLLRKIELLKEDNKRAWSYQRQAVEKAQRESLSHRATRGHVTRLRNKIEACEEKNAE